MEVYAQTFDSHLKELEKIQSVILKEDSFANLLEEGRVYFIGDGVKKTKEVIQSPNAIFLEGKISSREMGELAWEKFKQKLFEDTAYFVPNYLKEFKVLTSKKNLLMKWAKS